MVAVDETRVRRINVGDTQEQSENNDPQTPGKTDHNEAPEHRAKQLDCPQSRCAVGESPSDFDVAVGPASEGDRS